MFANNDEMAIGAIQALKASGIAMEDVVVVGVDVEPKGRARLEWRPAISTPRCSRTPSPGRGFGRRRTGARARRGRGSRRSTSRSSW